MISLFYWLQSLHLYPNWKTILRKAWSVRLLSIAAVLSGCEAVFPYCQAAVPHAAFITINFLLVAGAFVARLVAQKDV